MTQRDAAPLLQWGVGSKILSIAVSHDGTRAASGSQDNVVRVWDVQAGTLVLGPLEGHTSCVQSVAWSHDDTRLVSGSLDNTIRIWDMLTGYPIGQPLRKHTNWIWSVAFSPDSTRVASGSEDRSVRIWNVDTGTPIGDPLWGHTGSVRSVVFSPDSPRIASGSFDGTVRIWNAHTGAPIGEPLRGHTDPVLSVVFSHDSTRVVSGSWDNEIRIWDAHTRVLIGEPLRGHTHRVNSVALSGDSAHIVSGSDDKTIHVWGALTRDPIIQPFRKHADSVMSVVFTPDGSRIISGSANGIIWIWEVAYIPPSFDLVSSDMSTENMFECLVQHGCPDLSSSIDPGWYPSEPVANGSFGQVWRVTTSTGLALAVKTLNSRPFLKNDYKAAKRAAREVHHWSKLRHPNVQRLLGIVVFRGQLGMVSPWAEHGNLSDYVGQHTEVARYPLCIQLTKGVLYLHAVGMVHGDLKANNVLVAKNVLVADDVVLKITDFDHGVLLDSTLLFSKTTRPGGGTLRWMAPELFQADDDDDGDDNNEDNAGDNNDRAEQEPEFTRNMKTDVYALGMTILEIFTGTVPYSEYKANLGVYRAIHTKKPPKRPRALSGSDDTTSHMWELLLRCWDHDPLARPDVSTVLEVLQSFNI